MSRRRWLAVAVAALAASVPVPLLALLLLAESDGVAQLLAQRWFVAAIWMGTVAHVLVIGVPAFLLLGRLGHRNGWRMATAGLLGGALPIGLSAWPRGDFSPGSTSEREVLGHTLVTMQDGLPTLAGYAMHVVYMAIPGLLGMVSALVFWWCWRRLDDKAGPSPPRHRQVPTETAFDPP